MSIKANNKEYACYFEFALDMISGKWSGLILWHLREDILRHNQIQKKLGKITQKMLTQTLRDLESKKLIHRKIYPVVPPKVEYRISDSGKKLIPIFKLLQIWGMEVETSRDA